MTNFSQTYIDHGYMELKIPANADGQVRRSVHRFSIHMFDWVLPVCKEIKYGLWYNDLNWYFYDLYSTLCQKIICTSGQEMSLCWLPCQIWMAVLL